MVALVNDIEKYSNFLWILKDEAKVCGPESKDRCPKLREQHNCFVSQDMVYFNTRDYGLWETN